MDQIGKVILFITGMFAGMAMLCLGLYISTDIQEIARYGMQQYLDAAILAGVGVVVFLTLYLLCRTPATSV